MNSKSDKSIRNIMGGILLTLVCLGPFGNLIFSILTCEYKHILMYAIATFPTLIVVGVYWCWYIIVSINVKNVVEKSFENSSDQK